MRGHVEPWRHGRFAALLGREGIVCASLCLLALGLRLKGLSFQSLWTDELATALWADAESLGAVLQSLRSPLEGNAPGYPVLAWLCARAFGDSELWLRLPAALAGVLAVFSIYWLGSRAYGMFEGAVAAGFTAIAWVPLHHSQDARPSIFAFLFAVWSAIGWTWLAASAETVPQGRLRWTRTLGVVFYAASCALLATFHHFGLILVGIQGVAALVLVLRRRLHGRGILWAFPLAYVFYLPAQGTLLQQMHGGPRWIPPLTAAHAVTFFPWLFDLHEEHLSLIALLVAFTGAIATVARAARRESGSAPAGEHGLVDNFVLACALGPVVVCAALSVLARPVFVYRYLIVCAPFAFLHFARTLGRVPGRFRRLVRGAGIALLGVSLLCLLAGDYYTKKTKADYRAAMQYAADHVGECSQTVLVPESMLTRWRYYSRRYPTLTLVAAEARLADPSDGTRPGRFWYMLSFDRIAAGASPQLGPRYRPIRDGRFQNAMALCLEERTTSN